MEHFQFLATTGPNLSCPAAALSSRPGSLLTVCWQHGCQRFYPLHSSPQVTASWRLGSHKFPFNQVLIEDLRDRSSNKMMTVRKDGPHKRDKKLRQRKPEDASSFHTRTGKIVLFYNAVCLLCEAVGILSACLAHGLN